MDEVEAGLDHPDGSRWAREGTEPAWSMTSADGITVDVVVEETHDRPMLVEVSLRASVRRRRPLTADRRVYFLR